MTATDPAGLTIAEAAAAIEARQLSPVEMTDACLSRIEAVDGRLNAFITVMAEEARRDARAAAEEIAGGRYRGPLHGIPVGLKDIIGVAGVRLTAGSKVMADRVAEADAGVTERLRAAGAVIIGKLNLHEVALGATGINPHFGPARNPWDTERITGGSSSGSGASVAGGEVPAALGTDTGGSIRIPASLCGVVGLKPTFGRVTRRGVIPLSWSLDHVGPLTRTVRDAALVMGVVAGQDAQDASSSSEAVPDFSGLESGVRGLRIGIPNRFFLDAVDGDVESAFRAAVTVLEGLGAEVREVPAPYIDEIPGAVSATMLPEALAYHQKWLAARPDDYGEDVRYRLEVGATYTALHYVQAQRLRELAVAAWRDEVFSQADTVLTPTTPTTARPIGTSELQTTISLARLTNPFNLLGVPTVSVPCGFTGEGLPIGLQLAARWFAEPTLLRAAHAYEQATEWHTRRPEL